jgi:hypothetical protein
MSTKDYLNACHHVKVDEGIKYKLKYIQLLFQLCNFKHCFGFSVIFKNLIYLALDFEQPGVPRHFDKQIGQRIVVDIVKDNWHEYNNNLKEEF